MTSFLDEVQARALVGSAERVLAKHDQKATYIRSAAARLLELAAQLFGSALRGEPANIRLRCAQVERMRALRTDVRPDGVCSKTRRARHARKPSGSSCLSRGPRQTRCARAARSDEVPVGGRLTLRAMPVGHCPRHGGAGRSAGLVGAPRRRHPVPAVAGAAGGVRVAAASAVQDVGGAAPTRPRRRERFAALCRPCP